MAPGRYPNILKQDLALWMLWTFVCRNTLLVDACGLLSERGLREREREITKKNRKKEGTKYR